MLFTISYCCDMLLYDLLNHMCYCGFSNPMQAKHLEVARMEVFGVMIDFVNLRSAGYTEKSFMFSAMVRYALYVIKS